MQKRFYLITRDLHLYAGLFISPFVVLFALSVFTLVHPPGRAMARADARATPIARVAIPREVEALSGRARIDAIRPILTELGIHGEIGFIRYSPKEHRLSVPVTVPGRETTLDVDLTTQRGMVTEARTGLADTLVLLHKSPGPHLADIRKNWLGMRIWSWFADATVYLVLFLSVSGIYLWTVLRAERRIGLAILAAGAITFCGMVYALVS